MKNIKQQILRIATRVAIVLFFATGLTTQCANPMLPQGGPRDTLPPVVVSMLPKMGATNFKEKRVFIEFDEYIKLKDQHKEFYSSPGMKKKPTLTLRGKGVRIDIHDTLQENTTYSLNFGSSIEDNNENNTLHSFRYVFSTGEKIDSMVMSGYAEDAYKKDSASKSYIYFFKAEKDSIPDYDSLLFNSTPDAIARAENNGIFIAENLKPIEYRVYAMQDANDNQIYDPGVDKVGILAETYNPLNESPFEVWYDTMRMYFVAQPQLHFRMFKDVQFKRQYLASTERPTRHRVVMAYGAEYPLIDTIRFQGIDSTKIIIEYLKPTQDSITYWFNVPKEQMPDTLRGFVTYMKHDSINQLIPEVKEFALVWKESKQVIKEREEREKERLKAIEEGKEPEAEPNPFKVAVDMRGELNPEKNISMEFDCPLVQIDSSAISLIRVEGENMFRVRNNFVRDTANIRKWHLTARWVPGQKYKLEIPAGVFVDVTGEKNDTLKAEFSVMQQEKFATLVFNVNGKTPQSHYVLQLLEEQGDKVIEERRGATQGTYTFRYIPPGGVRLRVIEDINANGEWDQGNLVERRQPERVEVFVAENGEPIITTRANWELKFDVNMEELFAPVTMQMLSEQLRKEEQIRIRKYLEELEKNPPKKEEQTRPPNRMPSLGSGGLMQQR